MQTRKTALLGLCLAIVLSALSAMPARAAGATISKITVNRRLAGNQSTVTIWQGAWVNQTVEFDVGTAPEVTIYTTGGSGTIYYQLRNDDGYNDTWNGTASSKNFYVPGAGDYKAQVDGNWLGGSMSNEFTLDVRYPDLISSVPEPNATAPFCEGQVVEWSTTVTNDSTIPTDDDTRVGYYLGTHASDLGNRWEDDGVSQLDGGESSDEHEDYTFTFADVGTRYMLVKADYQDEEQETDEGNNIESSSAFEVKPRPGAEFTSSYAQPIVVGTTINFTDQSSGNPTARQWTFGDGGQSNLPDPSYQFNSVGSWTVTLVVTNQCGSDIETKVDYIVVEPPPPDPPVAAFSAAPTTGVAPLSVTFADESQNEVTSWSWDFGDGGTSTLESLNHVYASPGTYAVTLTVSGPGGSDTHTEHGYIVVNEPQPIADFSGNPQNGVAPLSVSFSDLTTGAANSWSWDFGDGNTSADREPIHEYTTPGIYTVSLTVAGPGGIDTATKESYISVEDGSNPQISDVKVTNLRDTSFVVSWQTDMPSTGRVEYGIAPGLTLTADDDRGVGHLGETHYATLSGLLPSTAYSFRLVSGASIDDNGGANYQATTGTTLSLPDSDTVYGQVTLSDGASPATGAIAYLTVEDQDGNGDADSSAELSSLVDVSGYWNANLGNARTQGLTGYFGYSAAGDGLAIQVMAGSEGVACAILDTADDSPATSLILGGACSSESNQKPDEPHSPTPPDQASNIDRHTSLSWTGSDPDGDPLTYRVLLDPTPSGTTEIGPEDAPSTVVCPSAQTPNCDPGELELDVAYMWQVIASDGISETASEVWTFATLPCYELTLSSDPLGNPPTATPANSDGCDPDHYIAGQPITLTAHPPAGHHVIGWTGTDDDVSMSLTNTLTLPASEWAATVHYETEPITGCVEPPSNIVAWWTGDGTVDDQIGLNHGVLQGGAGFAPGLVGDAFSLEKDSQSYVHIPTGVSSEGYAKITVEGWIRTSHYTEWTTILSKFSGHSNSADDDSYWLAVRNNYIMWQLTNSAHESIQIGAGSNIANGEWRHIAATWDGVNRVVYIDGVLIDSQSFSGTELNPTNEPLFIGRTTNGGNPEGFFGGLIDELTLYDRALSPTEIQAIYRAGTAGKCKVQVEEYPYVEEFNGASLFTTTDPDFEIRDGKLRWSIDRGEGPQFAHREIPPFSGDVKITVRGQIDSAAANCGIAVGIGDGLDTASSSAVSIGKHGAGCAHSDYYIGGAGVNLGYQEEHCVYGGNWLWIDAGQTYTAELTVRDDYAWLRVPGVGSATGKSIYRGEYNTLYLGHPGPSGSGTCSGSIDAVIIEPLGPDPLADAWLAAELASHSIVDATGIAANGTYGAWEQDGFTIWERPLYGFGHVRPTITDLNVTLRFALSPNGDLTVGAYGEPSETLALLVGHDKDWWVKKLTERNILLSAYLLKEYQRLLADGYVSGGNGENGDIQLWNRYGQPVHVLYSALTMFAQYNGEWAFADRLEVWDPSGPGETTYTGNTWRIFDVAYAHNLRSMVFSHGFHDSGNSVYVEQGGVRVVDHSGGLGADEDIRFNVYPNSIKIGGHRNGSALDVSAHIAVISGTLSTSNHQEHPSNNGNPAPSMLTVLQRGGSVPPLEHEEFDVDFTASPLSGDAPLRVELTDLTSATVTSATWTLGDGTTRSGRTLVHTYTQPGQYTVTLSLVGPGGAGALTKTNYISVTAPCYRLDIPTNPPGFGDVTQAVSQDCSEGHHRAGERVLLTATLPAGWGVGEWNGTNNDLSTALTNEVTMPASDHIVGVSFRQIPPFDASISISPTHPTENDLVVAIIGGDWPNACVPQFIDHNTYGNQHDIYANTPDYDSEEVVCALVPTIWSFQQGLGTHDPDVYTVSLYINGHLADEEQFEVASVIDCHSLSTSVDPPSGGLIERSHDPDCTTEGGKYEAGTHVTLTATPVSGYEFISWTGHVTGTNPIAVVTMDEDKQVTAHFRKQCFDLDLVEQPVEGGNVSKSPEPNCATEQADYEIGSPVTLTAAPASGYEFDHWTGHVTGTNQVAVVTMDEDKQVTAHFRKQCFDLDLDEQPDEGGDVSKSLEPNCVTEQADYEIGSPVTLTATPASGYIFMKWLVDGVDVLDNPTSITMDANHTVTAIYEAEPDPGSIIIVKQVEGSVPDSDWTFTGNLGTFTLPADGGQRTFAELEPGQYTIDETTKDGYLVSVEGCTTGENGSASVTVELAAGEEVTCTFVNRQVDPGELPQLSIPSHISATPGMTMSVPITFAGNGHQIVGLQFSVDFAERCLNYMDAHFTLPSDFDASATFDGDDTDGEIDILIFSTEFPFPLLSDGELATIEFEVKETPDCTPLPGETYVERVGFSTTEPPELTDASGAIVPGVATDGSVAIISGVRGDCNDDGSRTVADIIGTVLEINDGDGKLWLDAPGGTYAGSPMCDSNSNTEITVADVICTVIVVKGEDDSCTLPQNLLISAATGELSIGHVTAEPGQQVAVPVTFDSGGQAIAGAAFSIQWDATQLHLADANGIHVHAADDFTVDVTVDDGTAAVTIVDMELPLATLPDGGLLALTFTVAESPGVQQAAIRFGQEPFTSLGDVSGTDVPVVTQDGSVAFGDPYADKYTLFVPLLSSE